MSSVREAGHEPVNQPPDAGTRGTGRVAAVDADVAPGRPLLVDPAPGCPFASHWSQDIALLADLVAARHLEWAHGYARRFGIIWVDYETQARTLKDSGRWYQQLIASRTL